MFFRSFVINLAVAPRPRKFNPPMIICTGTLQMSAKFFARVFKRLYGICVQNKAHLKILQCCLCLWSFLLCLMYKFIIGEKSAVAELEEKYLLGDLDCGEGEI